MKCALTIFLLLFAINLFAQQQETFDLITFTPPVGWKKEAKENVISYSKVNNNKKTWCQIGVYKSTVSKGNIQQDFDSEWQELIVKSYKPATKPELIPGTSDNGWDTQGGSAPFEYNGKSIAMLVTMSGFGRCTSIVILTNTQDYQLQIQDFLGSVDLKKMETVLVDKSQQPTDSNNQSTSIIGSWGKSNSVGQLYNKTGTYSYNKQQYTFSSNGTYFFNAKNYSEQYDETLLIKESGTYLINENKLTINPQKSVIEAWSKKNGGDNWNQLKTSQPRKLEKTTYQIAIVDRNLVLQTDKETERDGRFTSANLYSYGPTDTFTAIQLPDSEVQQNTEHTTAVINTGFKFTSTNFDDGWVSTVQEDWVEVTKGNIKVLLHYPKEGTIFPADPEPLTNAAWNILVAPRYSNLKNYRTSYVEDYNSPYFGMGYTTEIKTGKSVFVVLFRRSGGWIEVVMPDNNSFTQEFGFNPESIRWGSITEYMGGWVLDNSQSKTVKADPEVFDRLEKMATYNKFAVAASDFTGRWTNDFTGIKQMYHVYSGQYAGMNINQSNEEFDFKAGNTYNWKLLVVNGMVGNVKANQVKSSGTFSVPNNWQLQFSNIEDKPKIYNAFFSCVKGARLLNLLDAQYPGSGIYTQYGMAK